MAQARIRIIEKEGTTYRLTFDGRFVHVVELIETGRNVPFTAKVDDLTAAKIIFEAGRNFSRSKAWRREWRMASNEMWEAAR